MTPIVAANRFMVVGAKRKKRATVYAALDGLDLNGCKSLFNGALAVFD
jgi:hypothetical protein